MFINTVRPILHSLFRILARAASTVPSRSAAIVGVSALALSSSHSLAASPQGPVTWVKADPQTRVLQLDSSLEGAELRVTDPETGKDLNTPEALYEHGWIVTNGGLLQSRLDGFYESIPSFDTMGRPLRIEVKNLYPGEQEVGVQYFSQPFAYGTSWSYAGFATLADHGAKAVTLDYSSGRIIQGTGGHDQTSRYEKIIGTAGNADEPAVVIDVTIGKNKWAKQMTFAGLRIISSPSMDAALTRSDRPAEKRIRRALESLGSKNTRSDKPAWHAAVIPSAVKVKPKTFSGLEPEWLSEKARLGTARNSRESFQILLYSPENDLTDVTWDVEGPVSANGKIAGGIEVMVAPVGYVRQSADPYTIENYGWLPEPILTFMDSFNVKAGDAQTVWVRFTVPAETEPGIYRGSVVLRPAGQPVHSVPFELEVWDIERPSMPHLPVVVGLNPTEHYQFLMEYGINPSTIYGESIFAEESEEKILSTLREWEAKGVTAINLGYVTYGDSLIPLEEKLQSLVDRIERNYNLAKQAGLGKQAYFYMFDEATQSEYPAMKIVTAALKERMPDLTLMTTAYWGENLDFGVDAGIQIDTWVPIVQHFRNSSLADIGRDRGREVWWYTCNYPPAPMPNIFLTGTAMETRMLMGVMPHAYRVSGFLYYAVQGNRVRHNARITEGPYTDLPEALTRGDCYDWFYLNGPGGIEDPMPSLRMENLADGLADYDLISIALHQKKRLEKAGLSVDLPIVKLLGTIRQVPNPHVSNVLEYTRDPLKLEALRWELAEYIQAAQKKIENLEKHSQSSHRDKLKN